MRGSEAAAVVVKLFLGEGKMPQINWNGDHVTTVVWYQVTGSMKINGFEHTLASGQYRSEGVAIALCLQLRDKFPGNRFRVEKVIKEESYEVLADF